MQPVAIVLGFAVLMVLAERLAAGRRWPVVRGWWLRAGLANALQVGVVWLAGRAWDPWLVAHRPWSVERLGTLGAAALGYLVITFVYYWWHRWRHESELLWRVFHQLHHSPQRIEVITSFYKHPAELIANGVLSSAILYLLVGVTPPAAALAVTATGIAELFYHWNVRTPHWLGFLIQRPESHCIHHEEGFHRQNFGDLPLWDWLFGTLENPRAWPRSEGDPARRAGEGRCGFGDQEHALGALLRGQDVTRS